jgi:hypothetical protein
MRAELKRLHSPDIDLAAYWPDDQESFHFLLRAMIGPENSDASESFDFEVCTPAWLAMNRASEGLIFGRHWIIVFGYDLEAIESRLKRLCSRTMADTWQEIAKKLGRYGKWEFEDYRMSP